MKMHRTKCLAHLVEHYPTWPGPEASHLAATSHFGYQWVLGYQSVAGDVWVMENELHGDIITEHDYNTKKREVGISFSRQTDGTFLLRIENDKGVLAYALSAEDFAKAVSGGLACGVSQDY